MPLIEKRIVIDARDDAQATEIAKAMLSLMKITRKETSIEYFLSFTKKIEAKPSLIKKAQMFI